MLAIEPGFIDILLNEDCGDQVGRKVHGYAGILFPVRALYCRLVSVSGFPHLCPDFERSESTDHPACRWIESADSDGIYRRQRLTGLAESRRTRSARHKWSVADRLRFGCKRR